MTATEIIEEIKRLPKTEQLKVAEFARQVAVLSAEELGELAKRMVETADPAEADQLEQEILRGFYPHGSRWAMKAYWDLSALVQALADLPPGEGGGGRR